MPIIDSMPKDAGPIGSTAAMPKPGQTSPDFVREYTAAQLQESRTPEALLRTVAKMDAIAEMDLIRLKQSPEGKVACKPGCDHCCHRIIGVTISEAIQIAVRVTTKFTQVQREQLLERCRTYASSTLRMRDGMRSQIRAACPLLLNHMCSAYDVRPLGCRGSNSRSAAACEAKKNDPTSQGAPPMDPRQNLLVHAVSDAHARALHAVGLPHYYVDLGLALRDLLEHPDLIERYLGGEAILMEHSILQPGSDPIREERKAAQVGPKEPSGFHANPAIPGHPVYEFMRLSVPSTFSSESEIDACLSRYEHLIEDFLDTPMDAAQAFDGLVQFQAFGLPYTGRDVTQILRRVGEQIVAPVVAKALPDLAASIELRKPEGKLRVGYLSYNIIAHHATNYVLGWISNHAEDIESFVFHVGPKSDGMTGMFRQVADHFFNLPGDVPSTARFIKSLNLDVLIFPDIGNFGPNYQYAGMRLAPVQCTAWGQPVTSGLPTIDYYLSSELMEPENGDQHYTEKLIRLPGSGLHWSPRLPPPSQKSREDLGIPEGLVYFVAQNIRKLTPEWDFLYAEIQAKTGAPICFIEFGVDVTADKTRDRLAKAGVKATWLPKMIQPDFVRAQQLCDVSLDPPAWNGGNTTVYGLAVGSPIVTLPGSFMRSRHGLAFMKQANVSGMIAASPEDYVNLATDLERIHESMKPVNVEGILRDPAVPPAVDEFLRTVSGRN